MKKEIMKPVRSLLGKSVAAMALGASLAGHASIYSFAPTGGGSYTVGAGDLGQVIPDNNPSGVAYTLNFGAAGLTITDIRISLNISGGWNGDLYAYLSHGSDYTVLLNRVGAATSDADGYSTSGFDILLAPVTTHAGIADIHTVPNPSSLPMAYAADGRVAYTDTSRPQTLDRFLDGDPDGSWTLFLADLAAGNASTLNRWEVDVTVIPEPGTMAMGCFAGVFLVATLVRGWRVRRGGARG